MQAGSARDRTSAYLLALVSDLFPAFLRVLQLEPGPPFLRVKDARLDQIFQRLEVLLQIEEAIAQLKIKFLPFSSAQNLSAPAKVC